MALLALLVGNVYYHPLLIKIAIQPLSTDGAIVTWVLCVVISFFLPLAKSRTLQIWFICFFTDRHYWRAEDPINLSEGFYAMANVLAFCRLFYLLAANDTLGPLQVSLRRMIVVSTSGISLVCIYHKLSDKWTGCAGKPFIDASNAYRIFLPSRGFSQFLLFRDNFWLTYKENPIFFSTVSLHCFWHIWRKVQIQQLMHFPDVLTK